MSDTPLHQEPPDKRNLLDHAYLITGKHTEGPWYPPQVQEPKQKFDVRLAMPRSHPK